MRPTRTPPTAISNQHRAEEGHRGSEPGSVPRARREPMKAAWRRNLVFIKRPVPVRGNFDRSARQCGVRSSLEIFQLPAGVSRSRARAARAGAGTTSCTSCPPRRASPASASPRGAPAAPAAASPRPPTPPGGPASFPADSCPPRNRVRFRRFRRVELPRRAVVEPARAVSVRASDGEGPRRGGEDEPDRDEDGLYIGTYSNFFTDPDQIKGVIIFCAFLASFASLGNIGRRSRCPSSAGSPSRRCIQGILFGYYCPP